MLTLNRPARLLSDPVEVDRECRAARWLHHRLLDFEDEHQRLLEATADEIAPGIVRVGRILARLSRRAWRAQRSSPGTWFPNPRPDLAELLYVLLDELRAVRNADPRWKVALAWANEKVGEPKAARRRRAKPPHRVKRRKNETDEAWANRFALFTSDETEEHYAKKVKDAPRRTRREEYRTQLYAQRRCHWGTWNALCRSVDQAVKDVLQRRKMGLPAEWSRPRFRDPVTLAAERGGFRIVERGPLWWTVELRIGTGKDWVQVRAKCGNWHPIPDDAVFRTAKLTRRQDGQRWSYSLSLTVEGVHKKIAADAHEEGAMVAFDWGHREHGHDRAADGLRAFVWKGTDGRSGEILIPTECRTMLDEIDAIKERLDETFNARKETLGLPDRNRHVYRRRLLALGVRREEEADWLRWEMRYERRIMRRRKRFQNLRRETYLLAVRELRRRYDVFAFEDERVHDSTGKRRSIRSLQTDDQMRRRARANRDLCARHLFVEICERFGAKIVSVSARNTTRECPECGHQDENTAELLMACSGCGVVRDKDLGAARVILQRAQEALADHAAE